MGWWRWLLRLLERQHDARCRGVDLNILWPHLVRELADLQEARAVFLRHCYSEPAWVNYFTANELRIFVENLQA